MMFLKDLVGHLLEGIKYDRRGGVTGGSHFQSDSTIYGVIQSFVSVEEYKKKGNLDLYEDIFEKPFLLATGVLQSHGLNIQRYLSR